MAENRNLPDPELINIYIENITLSISPINQVNQALSPVQLAVQMFIDHIKLINQSITKEGISVEKDLLPVLMLLSQPYTLDNISHLYQRILTNEFACARRINIAATVATIGGTALAVVGMLTLFAPVIVPAAALYVACASGGTLLPTGIGVSLDTRNKRGKLVNCERYVLGAIVNEILLSENIAFYAQAQLKMYKLQAHASNENKSRDLIFENGVESISALTSISDIKDVVVDVKTNLLGIPDNDAADEVDKLINTLQLAEDKVNNKSMIKNTF